MATPARARATGSQTGFQAAPVFARLNPGFDEYRSLTERRIPVVILEKSPTASASKRSSEVTP
jgi:hypothetical protein